MAESHKYTNAEKLREVFPDVRLRTNLDTGAVKVWDEKQGVHSPVEKGQYVVKIADRYEVHDEEPEKAHKAEAPKETKRGSKDGEVSDKTVSSEDGKSSADTPKAVKGNQTVVPEELGTPPGPEDK